MHKREVTKKRICIRMGGTDSVKAVQSGQSAGAFLNYPAWLAGPIWELSAQLLRVANPI